MADPTAPATAAVYIGVDLGTMTTRVARMQPDKPMPTVVRNMLSNESTATVAYFPSGDDEARSCGENAAPKAISKPRDTVTDLVAWMSSSSAVRTVGESELHVVQAAAYFIRSSLLNACPKELQDSPSTFLQQVRLCLALPSTSEAAATVYHQACLLAGVAESNILLLPAGEAEALYFHHHQLHSLHSAEEETEAEQNTVIMNIGAAHSSFLLLTATQSAVKIVAERSIPMGSQHMDAALVEHVIRELEKKHGAASAALRGDVKVERKLHRECRKAKEVLSTTNETRIQVEAIKNDIDVNVMVTRSLLEELAAPYVSELLKMLESVKDQCGSIGRVEVIGGGWRCPCVAEPLKGFFKVERLGTALDANLAVAEGCAVAALLGMAAEQDVEALSKPPHQVAVSWSTQAGGAVSEESMAALSKWEEAEAALAARDAAVHTHLVALNKLDSLILQSLNVLESCSMKEDKRSAAKEYLFECDRFLRGDEEPTTESLAAKHEEVVLHLSSEFPEINAYHAARKAEEAKKEEELERLSREKTEEESAPKSDPQRLRMAQRRREQGAVLFTQECWAEAQTRFVQALSTLGELYDTSNEENKKQKDAISLSCHLNIASCSVKLGKWRNAVNNCTSALELSPGNPKAFFRRGQAYLAMKELAEAVKDLEEASRLTQQKDGAVEAELSNAKKALETQKLKEKKMYARMFA